MVKQNLIFYDFEVFSKARWWMVVFIEYSNSERIIIINNKKQLEEYYKSHKDDIFIGYNSRGYDQWILKGILLGKDIFKINDGIIEQDKKGHQLVKNAKDVQLNNFDVSNAMNSLKQLEGFMGSMIKESSVPFDLNRQLTKEEVDETIKYCIHDVEETIKVFEHKKEDFDSQFLLIETFDLGMEMFNKTKAQLSAHILGTIKQESIDDEFRFLFPNTLKLDKYKYIEQWYRNPRNLTYNRKLEVNVADCPTTFAYGGVHGAKPNCFREGIILCFDVASLYPSIMINYDCLSRNVLEPKKYEEIKRRRLELKKNKDRKQLALKLVLNATYGILKDRNNPFYDPRMSNQVCVTGQLLLLDLVEKVEHLGEVLQMNTDGVYMYCEDMDDVKKVEEIAHEWEHRTKLELEFDIYSKIYQRDVNNYIIVDADGHYKSKGCVKERTPIDYDLPIITKAIIQYCVDGTPVSDTINKCDDLIEFQKIVKVSYLYKKAFYGTVKQISEGNKKYTIVDEGEYLPEKVLRVFASNDVAAKGIYKIKSEKKVEKIANTPDRCFILNEEIRGMKCPEELDKSYYITLAEEQLQDFIGSNDKLIKKKTNEEQILEVLSKNHMSFYEVLVDIKENTKVTNAILSKFIVIDAFKSYGKVVKLLSFVEMFKILYSKKNLTSKNIKTITDNNIIEILKSHSEYDETKNTFKNFNSESALIDIFKYIPDTDIHVSQKIRQEFDLYDDVTIFDSNVDENVLFIMNVNDTKNPSVISYNVKLGRVAFLKITKELFNILEIRERDFILVKSIEHKPVKIANGKDENGINIISDSPTDIEWWITEYEILDRDYSKNGKLIIDSEMEVVANG